MRIIEYLTTTNNQEIFKSSSKIIPETNNKKLKQRNYFVLFINVVITLQCNVEISTKTTLKRVKKLYTLKIIKKINVIMINGIIGT